MKNLFRLALLLSVCASAQPPLRPKNAPVPTIPAAVGKQERTQFFTAKHILCATLVERDHGNWYVYFESVAQAPDIISPAFHTRQGHSQEGRAEAYAWATHFCPVTK
jgi:hypothetical protein